MQAHVNQLVSASEKLHCDINGKGAWQLHEDGSIARKGTILNFRARDMWTGPWQVESAVG